MALMVLLPLLDKFFFSYGKVNDLKQRQTPNTGFEQTFGLTAFYGEAAYKANRV